MPNEQVFSPEYQPQPATEAEEPVQQEELIEYQLEEQIKHEVKVYGTGKPGRVFIRAKIIHD